MAKYKEIPCKSCGAEIGAAIKVCPYCGAKNKQPLRRKLWPWILVAVLLAVFLLLIAGSPAPDSAPQTSQPVETIAAPKEDGSSVQLLPTGDEEIPFAPVVVVDNEYCKITVTEIDPDNLWGYTIKTELENKSVEKTFMFTLNNCSINGVQCETLTAQEVAPGKKALEDISLITSTLEKNGIRNYTDIALSFRVYNTDDWGEEAAAEETVHLYPLGEENVDVFLREPQSSDIVLFETDKVKATVIGIREDPLWGYTLDLYLENKTGKIVMFAVDDASINGYMADPFFATELYPENRKFASVSWSNTTLEEIGISDYTSITDIEFNIHAYDSRDWLADHFADETVTINP